MSKKHKKIYATLNYVDNFLILASKFTGYVSIFVFASLVGLPIGNMSFVTGFKVCAITTGIKKY